MTPVPYFDGHCDAILRCAETGQGLRSNSLHVDILRTRAFAPAAQVFAVWPSPHPTWEDFSPLFERLLREIDANSDAVSLCRSMAEVRAANGAGKLAAIISAEGSEMLDCSLERLRQVYDRGLRIVNLCWNSDNALCGAAFDSGSGLTDEGRVFVRGAEEMGVLLDLSHASDRTFWDMAEVSDKPLFASHSDSRALCDCPRNLTDEQFAAIVRSRGCAGLNLCLDFLGLGRDIEAVVEHAEHFLALGGERAVALGGDMDGIPELPRGMRGVEDMGLIYDAMLRRNFPESLVRDIFWNNLARMMEKAL